MRQLLALGVMLWGEGTSGFEHVSRMLLAVSVGLVVIYLLNYAVVRAFYSRLGIFIGVAIFGYYYVYNPIGHNHLLVYLHILRSPAHLFNMLLLVLAPAAIGKFIDARLSTKNAVAAA
jgi:hypothetical protein